MITLNASGGSITFTFDGNSTYLNDGTITVPVNSLALIIDESDMATFRKAASNDIFVSANIAEFGMTKDELESWFKANAVGSTGGGGDITSGEVQTMIDESISGKADSSAVTAEISAAVSGKADTSYVDSAVSGKVDTNTYNTYTAATDSRLAEDEEVTAAALVNLNEVLSGKADSNAVYLKSETSGATEIATALSGKQDTLSAGTNITIVDNVISAEGGGKAIEAGRGISVTTGETADTVSFNLPISVGTGENSVIGNITQNTASGKNALAFGGFYNSPTSNGLSVASGLGSVSFGGTASGEQSFAACSNASIASGQRSATIAGYNNNSKGVESLTSGRYVNAENPFECSLGFANVSYKANNTFGNSGNTLFSVGNGTSPSARHNAFEIRQNGDIYLSSGGTDIKLQDHLGGGGSSYSAGTGIDITNDVISVTGMVATSAVTSAVTSGSTDVLTSGGAYEQFGGLKLVKLTESEYAALVSKDANTLYVVIPDPSNP